MTNEATQRQLEILEILIADYIASAQPVGSRAIARKHYGNLSPATVRNVMADLTDMGMLAQPHVSAGRIPTAKGMQLYVDTLLKRRDLTPEEMEAISRRCVGDERRMDAVLSRTSSMLAAVSRYAGIVVTPPAGEVSFKQIEFVPLSRGRLLGIFVSQEGLVQNRLIELERDLSHPEVERINNYCNSAFMGLTLEEALEKARAELNEERADYDRLLREAMTFSKELMSGIPASEIVVDGEIHLLAEPEFKETDKFKRVLEAMEEKRSMVKLLERCREAEGVRIFVGADADVEGVAPIGLVGAPYLKGGKVVGALGVIGPMRMDYSRVVPIVDFTSKIVSDLLDSK